MYGMILVAICPRLVRISGFWYFATASCHERPVDGEAAVLVLRFKAFLLARVMCKITRAIGTEGDRPPVAGVPRRRPAIIH